ncbi:MAG TPA: hypothetical protein PLA25_06450 [Anaerolineaceae bacterium]|nr:hypothetical protein [Anaerolineaceae bacterium]HQH85795.1 hypothetical protein [Anaerolineaceae bacterium]HQN43755.1 hypothetical protein [Anaerolineaceae bacterium]
MVKTIRQVMAVIGVMCIGGILGFVLGALIGGNFATGFRFNGVQGYEATAQIGFFLGALVGLVASGWRSFKRQARWEGR